MKRAREDQEESLVLPDLLDLLEREELQVTVVSLARMDLQEQRVLLVIVVFQV